MSHDGLDIVGINDELQDEERLVRDSVARFVDSEVLPIIGRHFADHTFPRDLIAPMARLGLLGSSIDGYGCAGLNAVSYGLICQELERGDSAIRSFVSVQSSLCMYPIYTYGSEAQKSRWLPGMAKGEIVGCFGLTESHGGSDPLNMNTTARRRGGDWVINGSKMWITNAPIADVALVWAKLDGAIRGFLVDRGSEGFSTPQIKNKLSLRASITGEIALSDVFVPEDQMLPGVAGLRGPFSCLNKARYGIAWGAMGAADFCLHASRDYVSTRKVFGKPLAARQLVQKKLADMQTEIALGLEGALALGRLIDQGAWVPEAISLMKRNNCGKALAIAREARDIHGGNGISGEYHVMRHASNLETVNTYEGAHDVHALILGRAITGENAF